MYNWNESVSNGYIHDDLWYWDSDSASYLNVTNFVPYEGRWIYYFDENFTIRYNVTDDSMNDDTIVNLTLDNESWVNVHWYSWYNDTASDTLETIVEIDSQYINNTVDPDESMNTDAIVNISLDNESWVNIHWYSWFNDTAIETLETVLETASQYINNSGGDIDESMFVQNNYNFTDGDFWFNFDIYSWYNDTASDTLETSYIANNHSNCTIGNCSNETIYIVGKDTNMPLIHSLPFIPLTLFFIIRRRRKK